MSVNIENQNGLAIISIDNPPVNALSKHVRTALVAAINTVNNDKNVGGALIVGAGKNFSAGADITEFGTPPQEPSLPDVIDIIENCRVPTLALIKGVALGGGLEVALGCRYRAANMKARLGLPEVNLGLIPGAGGTQRLPRLIGAVRAGHIIASGKPVDGQKAFDLGIVDAVFEGDEFAAATTFLNDKIKANNPRPALSQIEACPHWDAQAYRALVHNTKNKARGQISPLKALDAVQAAQDLPFRDGLAREREIFMQCMQSPQRAGLIHSFFAQRQVAKYPGLDDVAAKAIKSVGILGAGTMGVGIAAAFLGGGYDVSLFDINRAAQERGLMGIVKILKGNLAKARISKPEFRKQLSRLRPVFAMAELADTDMIIEAATENLDVKKSIFTELDQLAKPGAILASNTSYLDINILAKQTKRRQNVIGMHFFSPAHIMKLVEVVRTDSVSKPVLATVLAVAKSIGKIAVVSGVCDGFIGNRILASTRKQADYMIEDGALPQDIDRVMTDFGMAMGPFAVSDLAGLDIGYFNRRRLDSTRPKAERYCDIADQLYKMGRLGQKSGAGYYRYGQGSHTPRIDPLVTKLIEESAHTKGIKRRTISDTEIRERILCAMINEGAKILEDGIAARALDIDMVLIHGYGFPRYRGGPMFYADSLGAKTIYQRIQEFAKTDAYFWQPANLLQTLAKTEGKFADF